MGKKKTTCLITIRGLVNAALELDFWTEVFHLENSNKSLDKLSRLFYKVSGIYNRLLTASKGIS